MGAGRVCPAVSALEAQRGQCQFAAIVQTQAGGAAFQAQLREQPESPFVRPHGLDDFADLAAAAGQVLATLGRVAGIGGLSVGGRLALTMNRPASSPPVGALMQASTPRPVRPLDIMRAPSAGV